MPILCEVAAGGDVAAVDLLLGSGAEIEGCAPNGWTPLIVAANGAQADVVRPPLERGADRRATTGEGHTARGRVSGTRRDIIDLLDGVH